MTAPASYPPPLSAAPSVETLERLLIGLHQPMRRGVPTPPALQAEDRLFERRSWSGVTPVTPVAVAPRAGLTWSAGRHGRWGASPAAMAFAAAAATALASLAAGGDLRLP